MNTTAVSDDLSRVEAAQPTTGEPTPVQSAIDRIVFAARRTPLSEADLRRIVERSCGELLRNASGAVGKSQYVTWLEIQLKREVELTETLAAEKHRLEAEVDALRIGSLQHPGGHAA